MMTNLLNYILWQPDLEAFRLGPIAVRWYGLMWIIGLALAYLVVQRLYKEQKIKDELFDPLFIYCFLGILIGARLGHCIFYEPDYFLTSGKGFVEMFLPIHFLPDGDWKVTGYAGLASHGGTLGLMIALWLYVRKTKLSIWTVLDNIAIATGTTACFIRLGNLMKLHKRMPEKIGTGWYFGFCLTYIFTFRFFIEYTKEVQEAFEASLPLDMGQILSIPFVILGVYCMIRAKKA